MKLFRLKSIFALLFFILTSSLALAQDQSIPRDETLIRYGHMPKSLDPAYATSHGEYELLPDLFEGMVTTDETGAITPGLAERWSISENNLEYTFYLREGLVWSDGTKLTAQDFVTAFQRVVQPSEDANAKAHYLFPIIKNAENIIAGKKPVKTLGVAAIDERTLKIELEAPASYLISLLLNPAFYPVPTHIIEQHGDSWSKQSSFVSNGAYTLKSPVQDNLIYLRKNPRYYNSSSTFFNYLTHRNLAASDKTLALLARGKADIINDFYGDQARWLVDNKKGRLITIPDKSTLYMSLNLNNQYLREKNIRSAMSIVLNREAITERIAAGQRTVRRPAYSYSADSQSIGWKRYVPEWVKRVTLEERIERAKKLMKEAGFGPENKLVFEVVFSHGESNQRLINALNVEYSKIWIELRSEGLDLPDLISRMVKGEHEVALLSWYADFDDPINFLQNLRPGAPYNYSNWDNKSYESLAQKLVVEADPKKRQALVEKMEKLIDEELPIIPLTESVTKILVRNGVFSPEPNFFGHTPGRLHRLTSTP